MSSPVFISYSHKDSKFLDALKTYLIPLLRGKDIKPWDDNQILPGSNWREEIKTAIDNADVAILLVSQDFLFSDFIFNNELPPILEAAGKRGLIINWIHIRPSTYQNTPLERYQALGNPANPLSGLSKFRREMEMVKICQQIASSLKPDTCFDKITADSKEISSSGALAKEGIETLIGLLDNPEARANILKFKSVFGVSCEQIEILGFYKKLHDLLHTLQIKCYNYLISVIRMINNDPDDFSVWDNLYKFEDTINEIITGLSEAAENDQMAPSVPWINLLTENLQVLSAAVSSNSVEEITTAIRPIQKILSIEPVRLNDRLIGAARALPLPALKTALTEVQDIANNSGNEEQANVLKEGVEAFNNLDFNLRSLRNEHDVWQNIDIEIKRIEGTITRDLCDLRETWDYIKELLEKIIHNDIGKLFELIKEVVEKLDKSLLTDDARLIRQNFQQFRSRAVQRFYDVDLNLNALCENLREVGKPLTTVWEKIQ